MDGFSLKSRAIVFALCAGAFSFILALVASSHGRPDADTASVALIVAIVCGAMCWAAAERSVAVTAAAIDQAILRLIDGAEGDLVSPVGRDVERCVPPLANAMKRLFEQLAGTLDAAHRLAMVDTVTELPNRASFRRACEARLATQPDGTVAALLFIDLDRFKSVNDTLGHAGGDLLLATVADRLRAVGEQMRRDAAGSEPLIARLAGDEFTLFLPSLADGAAAERLGERLLCALGEPFELAGHEVAVGASIGIALHPEHGATLSELMRAADTAMYRAKAGGRGRIELFDEAMAAELTARVRLEQDLRAAIEERQFALAFQPQVSARDGRIVGAEALLRWHHPSDGVRLPGSFIERAEETGLIVEIGEWVVETVAATVARWASLGVEQRLAINVSRRQLDHAGFFRRLREAMLRANAPARLLELELSETLATTCSDDVVSAIAALRADGATIAIDDFGTGYSNLSRLRALPIDRVKLDRELVVNVVERAEARAIAQAVIGLIHGLGCEAVAEGIESGAQADVLRVIGCDVLQGYAIATPMDEGAFVAWAGTPLRRALAG